MTSILNFPKEERNHIIDYSSLGVHMLLIFGPMFLSSDMPFLFRSARGEEIGALNLSPFKGILGISSVA